VRQPPDLVRALGFTRERTPAVSTLSLVFRGPDAAAFEAARVSWVRANVGERAGEVVADGTDHPW
jgi:hypothetical protein